MIRRSLVPAVALLAGAVAGRAGAQSAKQAPRFEVDPMWPMPMPNRWILGSATGVADLNSETLMRDISYTSVGW